MNTDPLNLFSTFSLFIILVSIAGIYLILVTRNLLRIIIGLELLIKAVTLLLILVGYVTNRVAFAQSLVITIIVIEVIIVVVAGGIVLNIFRHNDSLDTSFLNKLKG